ncbi:protein tyrosine phosphatase [Grosmannia clavigera kw1407]|uniref:Protein tyrosine phosphatase n=1 Tax=Grosmannia clavigera (strain kw1407 / UAMH 11150) TaxID=655863 RepID=F0XTD4_GROCL|nr:protein tyrosine phosphatase [Grosmannia clavigera kw1407]EFW98952.1 protein tyrosine phosphatase [Grosmannia clavigera kw1407]
MTTIALTRPVHPHHASSGMSSISSSITLDMEKMVSPALQPQPPAPIPNKHVPICPPGSPPPADTATTPPPSPPGKSRKHGDRSQRSILFPPSRYPRAEHGRLALYTIDAAGVASALDYISRQPLPDPSLVFPWFHGLHPDNSMQQTFFSQRRRLLRKTPACLRGVTVVKADSQLHISRLKGAIAPGEFMQLEPTAEFVDVDPREGFSVRNFQIQAAKTAMTSDIIVYGDDSVAVEKLGWDIAAAQKRWRDQHDLDGDPLPIYNTFICTATFSTFEKIHPGIVAVDSSGHLTGNVVDFFHQERREMYAMTMASEISHNVWLGPSPQRGSEEELRYDILIECSDIGRLNPDALHALANLNCPDGQPIHLDFPSSGIIPPPTWSQDEADAILETCKCIYHLAHGITLDPSTLTADNVLGSDNDTVGTNALDPLSDVLNLRPRRILIHCADGYTESTMLAIAYFSYSTGRPVPDAWLNLHTTMRRNFFAYPTDVALLTALAPRLLCASPACVGKDLAEITNMIRDEPRWFANLDGSFPSRVLDYMYLGNLTHANNPDLLRALGITQILSVGEMAMWREGELEEWGENNVCAVQGVQDNGIDPLTGDFARCLDFIERGRRNGTATLVHCRVGVSRSATICIAEVMRSLKLSLPRAYCFVRARRLNVIIQPHLRFAYELLKWEELQYQLQGSRSGIKRELEWGAIAREVALMNQPYVR